MKNIALRQKKSGNYEVIDYEYKKDTDVVLSSTNDIYEFWIAYRIKPSPIIGASIIKASYRQSQTYFNSPDELIKKYKF